MTWVDFSTSHAASDRPLHSGLSVDLLQGNAEHFASQSYYSATMQPFKGRHSWSTTYSTNSSKRWYCYSSFSPQDVLIRPKMGGGRRTIAVQFEGKMSTSGVAHVRGYLLREPRQNVIEVDDEAAIPGSSAFFSCTFQSTAWSTTTGTISTDLVDSWRLPPAANATELGMTVNPSPLLDVAFLRFVVSTAPTTGVRDTVSIRGVRVYEVP